MPKSRFGFNPPPPLDAREYFHLRELYRYRMRFDTILKALFQSSRLRLLESLTHASVREWINVQIPDARLDKLDLVAWLARMVEYYLLLCRRYGVPPVQMLIYVGRRPLAMSAEIRHENMTFRYRAIDMRELDSEVLLQSPAIADNLLAILCHLN